MGMPEWALEAPSWAIEVPGAPIHQQPAGSGLQRPFTPQQLAEFGKELLEQFIKRILLAVAGFHIPGLPSFDQLKNWAENLPNQVVAFINNFTGINLASWDEFVASLADGKGIDLPLLKAGLDTVSALFGGIDLSVPQVPAQVWEQVTTTLIQPFIKALTTITAALLGPLSIGQLTDVQQTMLYEGGFDDPITVIEGDGITHDATDGVPGSTPLGCARVECDGTYKSRWSDPIEVAPNWALKAGASVAYESLVAAAGSHAVRVELLPYAGLSSPQATVLMASDESPSGTKGWGELAAGEPYVVPVGVTHVAIGWGVEDTATGGVAKFDDVYLVATQKIPQGFTKDLPEDLRSLFNWIGSLVDQLLTAVGITPAGGLLDRILDLSDEIEWIATKAAEGAAGAAQALADLAALINKLLTDPASVLGPISQSMVTGLVTALGTFNTAVNQIGDALIGAAVTPISTAIANVLDFVNALSNFRDTTTANQTNQQNSQITTQTAIGWRNPTWVCRYPVADVTYPEIHNAALDVNGVTGAQSTGTAHTHSMPTTNFDAWAAPVMCNAPKGTARVGVVTASNTCIVDTVAISCRINSGTINNVYIDVLRKNPAGGADLVASAEISAAIPVGAERFTEAPVPGFIVQAGEQYYLRIRNNTTNTTVLWINGARGTGALQGLCGWIPSSGSESAPSYSASDINTIMTAGDYIPWALMAAKNSADNDQTHTDNFNRGRIGSLWFLLSDTATNQLGISGNRAAFSGLTDGTQNALYVRPTSGDKMWVEATLYETTVAVSGPRCGLLLNCNRDLSQIVYLGANLNSAKIYTGPWNALTERASVATPIGSNDVPWQFYYDPATATYTALKDGQDIGLSWPDTSAVMQHGPDFRFGGLRISRAAFFNAGRIDNWTLRDWVS